MEKKKSSLKKLNFKTSKEMDDHLEFEDLSDFFEEYGKVAKPTTKKVNVDLPEWLVHELDVEANRAGISRQPLIKLLLLQKLDEERKKRTA